MRPLVLLSALLVLAGCATPSSSVDAPGEEVAPAAAPEEVPDTDHGEAPDAPAEGGAAAAPWTIVFVNGSITSAGAGFSLCVSECYNAFHAEELPPEGTAALVAELRWEGPVDLDLTAQHAWDGVRSPTEPRGPTHTDEDGVPGAPDAIARVEALDAAEFEKDAVWRTTVTAKGAVDAAFELRITFFQTAPPVGYSAFAEGA